MLRPEQTSGAVSSEPVLIGKQSEDEIYGLLGGLLGLLEVLSMPGTDALSERQTRVLDEAIKLGENLRERVEAIVTLASDPSDPRHQRADYSLRNLVDHAVRGVSWASREQGVRLTLPSEDALPTTQLHIDAGRIDRTLRGLTLSLVSAAARGGEVEVSILDQARSVCLAMRAQLADGTHGQLALSPLMLSAWRRVVALSGGALLVDGAAGSVQLSLPKHGEP